MYVQWARTLTRFHAAALGESEAFWDSPQQAGDQEIEFLIIFWPLINSVNLSWSHFLSLGCDSVPSLQNVLIMERWLMKWLWSSSSFCRPKAKKWVSKSHWVRIRSGPGTLIFPGPRSADEFWSFSQPCDQVTPWWNCKTVFLPGRVLQSHGGDTDAHKYLR